VPHLCEFYPGICLTTEEKAQKNLSQGSRRVPVGMMKIGYTEQNENRIYRTEYTELMHILSLKIFGFSRT
jgi:hypothetical protein